MRTSIKSIILAPALVLAAACSKDKPADPSLNADLGLAAQANTARMDSISAAERTAAAAAPAPVAATPTKATTTTPRRTTSTTTRRASSGSSSGTSSSGSSSAGTTTSAPRTVTVKNTKRDAAIGAGAGAIIGAATSRDKLKGGVIGAAAGGILGAVIGNNVDVKKKPAP
jgi:hypothetical protein